MVNFTQCKELTTNLEKSGTYDQYYIGERDGESRKNGQGENHWSGPKSLEWYNGHLLKDSMHGPGEYRWRFLGAEGTHFSYEGHFFCNRMHGYGTMSYPDGKVFTGLFHSNLRWGPGVETEVCRKQCVGLWRGLQLIRLAWRPATQSVAPDLFSTAAAKACVEPYRIKLATVYKNFGETNSAIDLLKQYGAEPKTAAREWTKLYPKSCTDPSSLLCRVEEFEHDYYKQNIRLLEQINEPSPINEIIAQDTSDSNEPSTYLAWNNNNIMIYMMKHCYTHDEQRNPVEIRLNEILSGPRNHFRQAGKHEIDCRTLLMASYLGFVENVAQLVNYQDVHPNIADNIGNNAVMYAACGDQSDLIHFLVEAGANVDCFNDSCCTPLGVALLRYVCAQREIPPNCMVQTLVPPLLVPSPPVPPKASEWNFSYIQDVNLVTNLGRTLSKTSKIAPLKKLKSTHSLKDLSMNRRKTDASTLKMAGIAENASSESLYEDTRIYNNILNEFSNRVNDQYRLTGDVSYLFEVNDMVKSIEADNEEPKKEKEREKEKAPKREKSKEVKNMMKPSKEVMWQSVDKEENSSIDSIEKQKECMLNKIMDTILQLLADGANPKLVRCPQPALHIAIISGSADLIVHLINHGADVNEVYDEILGYKPIDLAVSQAFTFKNLELVQTLLECGARVDHRLPNGSQSFTDPILDQPGPTLLHAVLARKTESEIEEEVRRNLLELLLEYNCNAVALYKGRSAIDVAMAKGMTLLDVFIRSRLTNLNMVINSMNQSILVKMFSLPFFRTIPSTDRVQVLTNLLLFGADPLLECANGDEKYANIFVFAKKTLNDLENTQGKGASNVPATNSPNKSGPKKPEKSKKEAGSSKSLGRLGADDVGDYKQAVDLVTECARMLHVRWIQAKLMKEIVKTIDLYKHRHWNMILKDLKRKKNIGLWLSPQRCLEIWEIMKTTKKKVYNDNRVLKHLLYIVMFLNNHPKLPSIVHVVAEEKSFIENEVGYLLRELKMTSTLPTDLTNFKRSYVKPELTSKGENKFNICFECALPSNEESIVCDCCKLVSFCSFECLRVNVDRVGLAAHPCSHYMRKKYFPSPPNETLL